MKPASFTYRRAREVTEALALLAEFGDEAKILAGGQSLVPMMNFRLARPSALVDVTRIPGLSYLRVGQDGLRIGALTTHRAVEMIHDPAVLDGFGVLQRSAHWIGHYPIRVRGPFGGSIAHADPASEWCLLAVLLEARIVLRGPAGERTVPAGEFFLGLYETAADPGEMITEVWFPQATRRAVLTEFAQRQGDFAIVAAAVSVEITGSTCSSARVILGGVGSLPFVVDPRPLGGQPATPETWRAAGTLRPGRSIRRPTATAVVATARSSRRPWCAAPWKKRVGRRPGAGQPSTAGSPPGAKRKPARRVADAAVNGLERRRAASEAALDPSGRWVGAAVPRKEDRRMLLGRAQFTGDLARPRMLHAAFARSPFAAARVGRVDTSAALSVPGVVAVLTAADLGSPYLMAVLEREEFVPTAMPMLADDEVRFVGEPVAVVIAEDPYVAEDAAEVLDIEWTPLPAISSLASAAGAGARQVHHELTGNCMLDLTMFDDGGLAGIFADAPLTVGGVFTSARVAALPLEGRACLAEWDDRDDQLVVHVSTQVPHQVRSGIAQALQIAERSVRVIAPDVGGGFGLKCVVGREEVVVAAVAMRLRRAVAWIEDRHENLTASFHGHEQRYEARSRVRRQPGPHPGTSRGDRLRCRRLLGVRVHLCGRAPDGGGRTARCLQGAGLSRARPGHCHQQGAHRRTYRGVSRPQIVLVMERLIEKAARALRLDPLEVRRINLISPGEFPYTGVNGITYDEGSYLESLDLAEQRVTSGGWHAERDRLRGIGLLAGIGYSCFSERTAYGTPTMSQRRMRMTPGYDTAQVRMDPSGEVIVTTGTCAHGQGHETTFAQIVADRLGVHPDQVRLRQGDTDLASYGWGTFGSRSIGDDRRKRHRRPHAAAGDRRPAPAGRRAPARGQSRRH